MPDAPATPGKKLDPKVFGLLFAVSVMVAVGNTGMQSILPAIGREIGIPDTLVAAIFSLSALLWAVMSPVWARQSDIRGRKPLILLGMAGFIISMTLCGLVVTAGLHKLAGPMVIFVFFLFARATFGLIGSASNPATQAYVAERTSREERTAQMATLAGAFGLGTIVGPAIAPLFVLPVVTLAGPMFSFAAAAAVILVLVYRYLPDNPVVAQRDGRRFAGAGRGAAMWKDPRLVPFLVYGFLVATCQTGQQQTLGFMIIDQLKLPPLQAQGYTAVAMMAGAVAGLLAQWGLIRMFQMGPATLMRWGVGLACVANLLTAFAPDYWTVVVGFSLACLGYGFARPGFTAGASLTVTMGEQAKAAGAIAMVNGINVILAPGFVWLYETVKPAPFILNAVILGGLLVYALKNRVLRAAGDKAEGEEGDEEATIAILERTDEGGV
ncbi:MAG: MFS transporter [Caulobacter sp.]|nr:MFS transporter [Caulobacter sp.]